VTADEFVELVEWIQDRWGTGDEVWANAARFAEDFKPLDGADVWDAVYSKGTGRWAPRPMELVAEARVIGAERRRREGPEQAQLPEVSHGAEDWREWRARRHPGKRWRQVIRERHAELFNEGTCRSPHCDVHRESPVEWPEEALKL